MRSTVKDIKVKQTWLISSGEKTPECYYHLQLLCNCTGLTEQETDQNRDLRFNLLKIEIVFSQWTINDNIKRLCLLDRHRVIKSLFVTILQSRPALLWKGDLVLLLYLYYLVFT